MIRTSGSPRLPSLALAVVAGGRGACGSDEPAANKTRRPSCEIWIRQARPARAPRRPPRLAAGLHRRRPASRPRWPRSSTDFETKLQQARGVRRICPTSSSTTPPSSARWPSRAWCARSTKDGHQRRRGHHRPAPGRPPRRSTASTTACRSRRSRSRCSSARLAQEGRRAGAEVLGRPGRRWRKAFTDKDPDGNGKTDTYGFVIPATTKRGYMSWYSSTLPVARPAATSSPARPGKFTRAIDQPRVGRRGELAQGPVLHRTRPSTRARSAATRPPRTSSSRRARAAST